MSTQKNNPNSDFALLQMHYLIGPFALCGNCRTASKVEDLGEEGGCNVVLHMCPKCRANNKSLSYKMRFLGATGGKTDGPSSSSAEMAKEGNVEGEDGEKKKKNGNEGK